MRISIAEIERCSQDVGRWVREKLSPQGGGPRLGYMGVVKLAIYEYHRRGGAAPGALTYLQERLLRFQGASQKATAESTFNSYVQWARQAAPVVAQWRVRLGVELCPGILLGGEVSRVDVDLVEGGYRAVLLGDYDPSWRTTLRMPLAQHAVASLLQRPTAEMRVGCQRLDGSGLALASYRERQIEEALQRAMETAERVAAEYSRQGGIL